MKIKLYAGILLFTFLIPSTTTLAAATGQQIYDENCKSCHDDGLAGAPKFGNVADWKERIKTGTNNLVQSAISGIQGYSGSMPPRGGNKNLTDEEVKAAVDYMIDALK